MKEVRIGNLNVRGYATLAPMAGVADAAFRSVCREMGAAMTTSEMVSAKALCYNKHDSKTHALMRPYENEKPFAVQLFGSEPEFLGEGARIAYEYAHPDAIDINMGCPVPKVATNGEGSALMRDPTLAGRIVKAVREAVECPVTVKMRLGWDAEHINAVEVARAAEGNGADAVTVHGRTREMFYSGKALWEEIAKVKQAIHIPVIANGDVISGESASALFRESGADLIAVGRGALGNPFLFAEITAFMENSEFTSPSIRDKMDVLLRQTTRAVSIKGEYTALKEARTHTMYYLKGLRGAAKLKEEAAHLSTLDELKAFAEKVIETGSR